MKKILILLAGLSILFAFNSCKKKYDEPPLADVKNGHIYSVAELKTIASCTNCSTRFTTDAYFIGVVIADELSGNCYKEIYVRDRYNTGGIHLVMKASHCNFFIGDSVHLNLKGYDVNMNSSTQGMLEIDTVDFEHTMVRFAQGANPQPIEIGLGCNYSNYLCNLVKINNTTFAVGYKNVIWADPIAQTSGNNNLRDCDSNIVVVRTSNYAKFAQQLTPSGYGSVIGIATAYGSTNQLVIRTPEELSLTGTSFGANYLVKDFNDNSLTSGGWSQQSVGPDPTVMWSTGTYSGAIYGRISGFYSSTNHDAVNWLISPVVNLSASSNPILTFKTAAKFAGNLLEVWVSTDYISGLPSTGTWTQLGGFNLSPNNPGTYAWTSSCAVPLGAFKNSNTRVAFRYVSSSAIGATTYELDDIKIREN
jgi:hypothetical protein